ncbi:MAG: DUF4321 domain-containing protein [Oscillospiraceae bacterium]|nr:DUF4321 domain-containing protein [Oscillospiraceae bacterium]MDE5885031.1 DUF4321 domain-containing protein [Oscillospiraceae bacterium]
MPQGILKGTLMFAILLAAVILGSLIGDFARTIGGIEWIGRTFEVGIPTFSLNLKVFIITLGFQVHVSVAEIVMILIGILTYPKVAKILFA